MQSQSNYFFLRVNSDMLPQIGITFHMDVPVQNYIKCDMFRNLILMWATHLVTHMC